MNKVKVKHKLRLKLVYKITMVLLAYKANHWYSTLSMKNHQNKIILNGINVNNI